MTDHKTQFTKPKRFGTFKCWLNNNQDLCISYSNDSQQLHVCRNIYMVYVRCVQLQTYIKSINIHNKNEKTMVHYTEYQTVHAYHFNR